MSFSSSGVSGGAFPQLSFVEYNAKRKPRQIVWKSRQLKGLKGLWLSVWRPFNFSTRTYMHWGVQIGPYLYELVTDEGLNGHLLLRRIRQDQMEYWLSDPATPDKVLGETSLTDADIQQIAQYIRDLTASGELSSSGTYEYLTNNCQSFVRYLSFLCLARDEWFRQGKKANFESIMASKQHIADLFDG